MNWVICRLWKRMAFIFASTLKKQITLEILGWCLLRLSVVWRLEKTPEDPNLGNMDPGLQSSSCSSQKWTYLDQGAHLLPADEALLVTLLSCSW